MPGIPQSKPVSTVDDGRLAPIHVLDDAVAEPKQAKPH